MFRLTEWYNHQQSESDEQIRLYTYILSFFIDPNCASVVLEFLVCPQCKCTVCTCFYVHSIRRPISGGQLELVDDFSEQE